MARSRSLPTNLFEYPDFFECSSETQTILIGLVLAADDYGRGMAHVGLLARKLNKEGHLIEQALCDLEACGMLECYQVDRHRYYSLPHWMEWETLSKPTPSKYPAPQTEHLTQSSQERSARSLYFQGSPGESRETTPEVEENRKKTEVEEKEETPPNVVTFPASQNDDDMVVEQKTKQVAAILKLTVTPALLRIVAEYHNVSTLSLLGEADAAREWIDDRTRNKKGQRLTPAFFRRWLRRELEGVLRRQLAQESAQTTGTTGKREVAAPRGSLMHLEKEYRMQTARIAQAQSRKEG